MDLQKAMAEVQDTLTVMAGIQARQAHVQKIQAEELDALRTMLVEGLKMAHEGFVLHEQRMAKFDEKMLEIEEKLDAMIRYVDGMRPPPVN